MVAADIYRPDQWHDFFLAVCTGAVTLTGLVFVALSLNVKVIAQDATHRYRAIGTLTGLTAVFLRCALVLMGGQNHIAVGVELLTISFLASTVYVNGYLKAGKSAGGASLVRTRTGTALYLIEMIGAIILISGSIAGLYVAAIAIAVNTCYMISGAWLLLMGVHQNTTSKN
jgi:hypothetical protein